MRPSPGNRFIGKVISARRPRSEDHAPGSRPIETMAAAKRRAAAPTGGGGDPSTSDSTVDPYQARLGEVIDAANDAYVATDRDGAIIDWSRQAERLFGWSQSEVLGRELMLIPPGLNPVSQGGVERLLKAPGAGVQSQTAELRAQHRDGHLVPIEMTVWQNGADTDRPGVLNAWIREARPNASDDGSCRVGSLVDSSEDAMIGTELDGTIVTWNRGAERLYGYSAPEALGRSFELLFPRARHPEAWRLLSDARSGQTRSQPEALALLKDGSSVEVAETFAPIYDTAGVLSGISLIVRDVSEQLRTAAELEAALEDARESEARSRRFLADAAHQLRTPIAGIRTCAETLLRGASPTERDRLLAGVVGETARAGRLMASLLQIARLDRGEPLVPLPCDLLALCEDEAARARRLAPLLTISVVARAVTDEKPELDGNAVAEIVGNLLDNARRHAHSRIDVTVTLDPTVVEVRVSDDGPGLAPNLRERAFERFASLDGRGGSGLGLAIGRGLANAHGGDLAYEGDAFVLRLPSGHALTD